MKKIYFFNLTESENQIYCEKNLLRALNRENILNVKLEACFFETTDNVEM